MMYKVLCLVALLVLGIVHTQAEQDLEEADNQEASDLYILDDKGQRFDEVEGSAVSDDEDSSGVQPGALPGDDEDGEGSGVDADYRSPSLCEREATRIKSQKLLGAMAPQCEETGEYSATQCSGSTGQCWCVNFKGEEIPGTISKRPWTTECDKLDRARSYDLPLPEVNKPEDKNKNTGAGPPTDPIVSVDDPTDDKGPIDIDPPEDDSDEKLDTKQPPNPDGKKKQLRGAGLLREPLMLAVTSVEIGSTYLTPTVKQFDILKKGTEDSSSVISIPGILAGLIAIAVVCLLCAVLLVMFIVYRMRKKDEGSYALDEPKRSPSHPYQRAPTREFFA